MRRMAGIADGSEWIEVRKLRQMLDELPGDAMVQASPLGNMVVYDHAGPIDGKQIAYIDLLTEMINREADSSLPPA
jgi:hypothetical protein